MGDLIAISGIDCAGKTTQLSLLERALCTRGHRAMTVWFRPGYSRELDAVRAAVRRLRPSALPTAAEPGRRTAAFRRPGVRSAWIATALADSLFHYVFRLRTLLGRGYTVLSDRWIEDAALDLTLRFPELRASLDASFGFLSRLAPRPRRQLLLMLPDTEMRRRMSLKPEPFPDPDDVRAKRYEAYIALSSRPDILTIDASPSIEVVHATILQTVLEGPSS